MVTRGIGHFSLVAAAPLPIFILLLLRCEERRGCATRSRLARRLLGRDDRSVLRRLLRDDRVLFLAVHTVRLSRRAVRGSTRPARARSPHGVRGRFHGVTAGRARLAVEHSWHPCHRARAVYAGAAPDAAGHAAPRVAVPHVGVSVDASSLQMVRVARWRRSSARHAVARLLRRGRPDPRCRIRVDARPVAKQPGGCRPGSFLLPNPNHPLAPSGSANWLTPRRGSRISKTWRHCLDGDHRNYRGARTGWRPPRSGSR